VRVSWRSLSLLIAPQIIASRARWQDIASDPPCATRRTVCSSPATRSTQGQIYVFGSGADFGASARSVERLAALAPPPRKLLIAHNVAVSDPYFLAALRDAVRAIASGAAAGTRDSALVT